MSRNGKLLGIAAVLLLALLIFMWRSMNDSSATPQPVKQEEEVAAKRAAIKLDTPAAVKTEEPVAAEEPAKPAKLDPMSDEFFFRFTEKVPKELSFEAAKCYEGLQGSLHRNQKLVLVFDVIVKDGLVSVHNVKAKPPDEDDPKQKNNTLSNPALESCFIQKVARVTWRDDALPDYRWPDELVLRPERGLKGYMKSDREYVGAEAPKRADPKAHTATKYVPPPQQPDPEDIQ